MERHILFIFLSICLTRCARYSSVMDLEHLKRDSVEFLETELGDDNIVISVPHGGYLTPASLHVREDGCLQNGECLYKTGCQPKSTRCKIIPRRDINALNIGKSLVEQLKKKGRKPHVVYMLVHRKYIDANRPPEEACQGMEQCLQIYNKFHNFIKGSREKIDGPGLYIDVHTIRHKANWTELGYRISKEELNQTGALPVLQSSIEQLRKRSGVDLEELVRGNRSLGNLLSLRGYDVIPSPQYPRPGLKGYARGGFDTLMYGSLLGGCIDGIQVEGSLTIRLGGREAGRKFGIALADAVLEFMKDFGYDDPQTKCAGLLSVQPSLMCLMLIILNSWFLNGFSICYS